MTKASAAPILFYDYQRQHRLGIRVARIFNTYGPNMHPQDGRVVSNFVIQALQGAPITIYGSGQQTRSFCYVDDLVAGLTRLMNCDSHSIGPVNLGNPVEITMIDLARKIIDLTGSGSRLEYRSLPEDDPKQRCPDISTAQELLHWQPKVPLEEGLALTIAYFEELFSRNMPAVHELTRRAAPGS